MIINFIALTITSVPYHSPPDLGCDGKVHSPIFSLSYLNPWKILDHSLLFFLIHEFSIRDFIENS